MIHALFAGVLFALPSKRFRQTFSPLPFPFWGLPSGGFTTVEFGIIRVVSELYYEREEAG